MKKWFFGEKIGNLLSSLPPPQNYLQPDGSDTEECVCGGFGDASGRSGIEALTFSAIENN